MTQWLAWLRDVAPHEPAALVSVLASEGSAPRGPGTRMLVTASMQHGTIGGGQLEYRAVEQARAILDHPPGTWRVQDYPLGPLLGQCCGGRVRLLVEHVDPDSLGWLADAAEDRMLVSRLTSARVERHVSMTALPANLSARGDKPAEGEAFVEIVGRHRRPLYLFGAGHVGQAIARHVGHLPLRLAWFDTRPELETVPQVAIVPEDSVEQCVGEAPQDAAIVIMTHDHGLDYRLTRAALARPPMAFVGLIGSATKRARFLSRLTRDGLGEAARTRLTSPIGVAGVGGKEPDVIAIATLAQLLQLRCAT
ncbi:xanthine dehydrogenase accessory protein XdhC [Sphingobium chlorophenolicum]|uniref:XdhC protein (Assists in molybdopterin insertion into xanthine dehydrogenase) n=1 Tax=Sphingobium chlorophenolicum TaxID=46429 RepID=A0A081RF11_SPHCR|nr:xanthine dehydrogenase accessory protein XdhC [Sphingobium chlorophenolicum]KEQ53784.1 XdhC protein (Assists in molybdopterin insertion into xanthine dehydrogenase) [Sphingobium chlorophenolicum]